MSNFFKSLGEMIENTIGEVQEGKLTTDRGHFALNRDEGIDIKLKPKTVKTHKRLSVSQEASLIEDSLGFSDDGEDFEPVVTSKKKYKKNR